MWRGECWIPDCGASRCRCTLPVQTTTRTIPTPSTGTKNQASHRNRRFQQPTVPSGDTPQRIATEKRSSNGQIQTDCHSSTTRYCRNHSNVQYERRDTTRTSSLYLQTFRICVRSLFWIQSPAHSTALYVWLSTQFIVPQPTPFRRRFNPRKAKWEDFSTDFHEAIKEVEHIPENYDRFIGLVCVVSRRHIPRGCRTNYIPGLTEESQSLYEAYKKEYSSNPFAKGTLETGNKWLTQWKQKRRRDGKRSSIDLTHNSRMAWQTIKKLSNDPTSPNPPCLVNSKPSCLPSARQWPRNDANKA